MEITKTDLFNIFKYKCHPFSFVEENIMNIVYNNQANWLPLLS